MHDFDSVAQRYIACWNETDAAARRSGVESVFAPDARYVDPMAAVSGIEAIDGLIAAVQAQFPGFTFTLAAPVDGHSQQLRFSWELGPAGAQAPVAGFDVAVIGADGRLETVLGFLDKVPA